MIIFSYVAMLEEGRGLHQSRQMRLTRWNTNRRIHYLSTNLGTVINVPDIHKKVGLPNNSTQSPGPERRQWRIVCPNRSDGRADEHKVVLVPHDTSITHVTCALRTGHPMPPTRVDRLTMNTHPEAEGHPEDGALSTPG